MRDRQKCWNQLENTAATLHLLRCNLMIPEPRRYMHIVYRQLHFFMHQVPASSLSMYEYMISNTWYGACNTTKYPQLDT